MVEWPILPAGWFLGLILHVCGFAGITMPNRKIYILPELIDDPTLRAHEQRHAMQCQRDGYWTFWFLICWYIVRYGYWNSPYEIEARAAAPQQPHGYWSVHAN